MFKLIPEYPTGNPSVMGADTYLGREVFPSEIFISRVITAIKVFVVILSG